MMAEGAGGPVCLILLPDLVYLAVVEVEVDMTLLDLIDLVECGVGGDEGGPLAEKAESAGIWDIAENLLEVMMGEDCTMCWVEEAGGYSQEPWWIP